MTAPPAGCFYLSEGFLLFESEASEFLRVADLAKKLRYELDVILVFAGGTQGSGVVLSHSSTTLGLTLPHGLAPHLRHRLVGAFVLIAWSAGFRKLEVLDAEVLA
jgi:hypothetical protein